MCSEEAVPEEAWVRSEEGEGISKEGEDVGDLWRRLRLGARGYMLGEGEAVA